MGLDSYSEKGISIGHNESNYYNSELNINQLFDDNYSNK